MSAVTTMPVSDWVHSMSSLPHDGVESTVRVSVVIHDAFGAV